MLRAQDRVLEIGSGSGWVREALKQVGVTSYQSIDINSSADFVGDIRYWRAIGLKPGSYDFIIAIELIEHVPCFQEIHDLLRPGGKVFLTSPAPRWDWFCRIMEILGLFQKRTSPHAYLIDFHRVPVLEPVEIRRFMLLNQWGVFQRPDSAKVVRAS